MQTFPDKSNPVELVSVARAATENTGFLESLRELLTAARRDVLRLGCSCRACGACCDFATRDHRLFVSTGELALLASRRPPRRPVTFQCPYQQENLCTARDRQPLGCRTFYCDPAGRESLHDLYETYHQRVISLHQEADIPYAYAELTSWLEAYWVEW